MTQVLSAQAWVCSVRFAFLLHSRLMHVALATLQLCQLWLRACGCLPFSFLWGSVLDLVLHRVTLAALTEMISFLTKATECASRGKSVVTRQSKGKAGLFGQRVVCILSFSLATFWRWICVDDNRAKILPPWCPTDANQVYTSRVLISPTEDFNNKLFIFPNILLGVMTTHIHFHLSFVLAASFFFKIVV